MDDFTYPPINLDLMAAFAKAGKENAMGPFQLDGNGKNYPTFKMVMKRLEYMKETAPPKVNEKIGVWEAGFGESRLITYESGKDLIPHLAHTVFRIVTYVVSFLFNIYFLNIPCGILNEELRNDEDQIS